MDNFKEKLKYNLLTQEKVSAIWYMVIFYLTIIIYGIVSPYEPGEAQHTTANNILGVSYYVIFFLFIIVAIIFIKKNRPEVVKYFYFYGFMFIQLINDSVYYGIINTTATYNSVHLYEMIAILFAPIFVNRKFFIGLYVTVITKYIIIFFWDDFNKLMPFGIAITTILSGISYIILHRFIKYVNIMKDAYEKEIELEGYKNIAYKDDLTQIHNKRFLNLEIKNLEKNRADFGIVMMDIDKFKSINDGYNHSVGDQALKHFVETIKKELSEDDIFARYGGEEFTLITKNRSYEETLNFINHIRKEVEKSTAIVDFNGKKTEINFTASFGLYYLKKEDNKKINDAQNIADNLLYFSKNNGRNRVSANKLDNESLYSEDSYVQLSNDKK